MFDRNPQVAQAVFPRIQEVAAFSMRTFRNHELTIWVDDFCEFFRAQVGVNRDVEPSIVIKRHQAIVPVTMRRDGTPPQTQTDPDKRCATQCVLPIIDPIPDKALSQYKSTPNPRHKHPVRSPNGRLIIGGDTNLKTRLLPPNVSSVVLTVATQI